MFAQKLLENVTYKNGFITFKHRRRCIDLECYKDVMVQHISIMITQVSTQTLTDFNFITFQKESRLYQI